MIKIKTINKQVVKEIPVDKVPTELVKGNELFSELYANIFLLAKKKSGKTSTIFKIIKECAGKNTTIIIFASTVHKDQNWRAIIKWLKEKSISFITYTSIFEGKTNHLAELVDHFTKPENEEEEEDYTGFFEYGFSDDEDEEGEPKSKLIAPDYMLIIDDLSAELKNPAFAELLKIHRHFNSKTIISSQYIHDLKPESIQQLDYILLWPNIPEEKLRRLHTQLDLSTSYPLFKKLYNYATKEKYNFLYVDIRNEKFRQNFNKEFEIDVVKQKLIE